ncbi:MAG: beta-glucosidase [Anaerolineae bacterium]|nr:beta-glucosidase [Anaerolineae bacterium]
MNFPDGFVFGAAASSYQIEGVWNEDGKGESIWDRFAHTPGKIKNGDTGDVACDFYHRYAEDIALMKELGLHAYRFSINWPRVLPDGLGRVNEKGLDFYKRVVDELLAAGIKPCVNLYHWELPQALQDQGGWMNRDCAAWLADFAALMVESLGDRVTDWMTLNEPMMVAALGHVMGWHAPGYRKPLQFFKVVHHLMLGHGLAARSIKAGEPDAKVGIALDLRPIYPLTGSKKDRRAVVKADALMRRTFLDPIFHGEYPPQFTDQLWPARVKIEPGDMQTIAVPLDYVGINTYTRDRVRFNRWAIGMGFSGVGPEAPDGEFEQDGVQYTSMGWEVYPPVLYEVLMLLKNEYGNPACYVTENGAAFTDTVVDGRVHDEKRTAYLQAHLAGVRQAIDEGSNCRGYFVWTLLDNFEWAEGYSKRFGIVYVNHRTQERIVKDSGRWYQSLIAAQG